MSPHVTQMSVSEAPDPSAAPSPRVFPQVSQAKKTPLSPCHPRDFKTKYGNSAGRPHNSACDFPKLQVGGYNRGELEPGGATQVARRSGPPDRQAGLGGVHWDEGASLTQDSLRPRLKTTQDISLVLWGGGVQAEGRVQTAPPCRGPSSGQRPHSDMPAGRSRGSQGRPLWLSPQSRRHRGGPEREGAALAPWPGSHCGLWGGEVAPSGALAPCGSRVPSQGHISPAQGPSVARWMPWLSPLQHPKHARPFSSLLPRRTASMPGTSHPLGQDPSRLPPALSVLWEPQGGCGRTVTQGRGCGQVEPRPEGSYEPGPRWLTSNQRRRYGRPHHVCSATAVFTGFALQPGQGTAAGLPGSARSAVLTRRVPAGAGHTLCAQGPRSSVLPSLFGTGRPE